MFFFHFKRSELLSSIKPGCKEKYVLEFSHRFTSFWMGWFIDRWLRLYVNYCLQIRQGLYPRRSNVICTVPKNQRYIYLVEMTQTWAIVLKLLLLLPFLATIAIGIVIAKAIFQLLLLLLILLREFSNYCYCYWYC